MDILAALASYVEEAAPVRKVVSPKSKASQTDEQRIADFFLKSWGWHPNNGAARQKLFNALKADKAKIPAAYRKVKGSSVYRAMIVSQEDLNKGGTIKLPPQEFSSWTTRLGFAKWFSFGGFPGLNYRTHTVIIVEKKIKPGRVVVYIPAVFQDLIAATDMTKYTKLTDRLRRVLSNEEVVIEPDSYYLTVKPEEIVFRSPEGKRFAPPKRTPKRRSVWAAAEEHETRSTPMDANEVLSSYIADNLPKVNKAGTEEVAAPGKGKDGAKAKMGKGPKAGKIQDQRQAITAPVLKVLESYGITAVQQPAKGQSGWYGEYTYKLSRMPSAKEMRAAAKAAGLKEDKIESNDHETVFCGEDTTDGVTFDFKAGTVGYSA